MSDNEASLGSQPILLQSKDHGELLDVIDILRSQGISRYISLPQLIVCGDQSSGKSSVLEAVSGVRFPTKDNLCTRFPTELILRRDREESAKVTIVPGAERTEAEKSKLHSFATSITSTNELPAMIDKAKETMGLGTDSKAFSDDVLRVEISGPRQPHLTLVDLPGLIHAENKQQSAADVQLVKALIKSYVANTRSIILAVVSAKNDYANQIVTKLAREVDPRGMRTLGIITKPDTLHVGSDNERAFLDLARNEDVYFRLGWHVLMNRDYVNKDCSVEERDQAEREFLSRGVWTSLPHSSRGVGTLKPRLSAVLRDQIISELPKLIQDLEAGIRECRSRLASLGDARTTEAEQRLYLVRVSQAFTSLVKGAVDGSYVHEVFGKALDDYSKRLRAVVTNILLDFAESMRMKGHEYEIVNDLEQSNSPRKRLRSDYIKHVLEIMKKNRGRELPGTFNPLIIGVLFYEQSRPWENLVSECCENILAATKVCIELFINHAADNNTKDGLLREIIEPAMITLREGLNRKIAEIMRPHQTGHPITYNHYFTETIQKARQEHIKVDQLKRLNKFFGIPSSDNNQYISQPKGFYTAQLLETLTQQTQQDMDQYSCSEATECMQAYYKVAMKVLVDNVAVLGIELCILAVLPSIFSPEIVMSLSGKVVQDIAAETEDARTDRARVSEKLVVLEEGRKSLNRLTRHKPKGADEESIKESSAPVQSLKQSPDHTAQPDAPEFSALVEAVLETESDVGGPMGPGNSRPNGPDSAAWTEEVSETHWEIEKPTQPIRSPRTVFNFAPAPQTLPAPPLASEGSFMSTPKVRSIGALRVRPDQVGYSR